MKKFTILFLLFFFIQQTNAQYWQLTGNSSTNPSTNFIGNIDGQQLVFRTNNTTRMRLATNASVTGFYSALSIGSLDPDSNPYGGTLLGDHWQKWVTVVPDKVNKYSFP